MPAPKGEFVKVSFIAGSLPQGEFIGGLPTDGSIISADADIAAAWIAAGYARNASTAAPAAPAVAASDIKE
jgi:hypothetical protein